MEYISDPRDLYNVGMLNKITMSAVTTKMVVECSMQKGGRAYKCMQRLHKLMSKRAIYPPSPLRLLRLANGKRCEFCNNVIPPKQHVPWERFTAKRFVGIGPFNLGNNPKPRQVRGNFPLFACYPCMTVKRPPSISKKWPYPCLTRAWEKFIWSAKRRYPFLIRHAKQFWVGNRRLMFQIFDHPRVLAYPTGNRNVDTKGLGEGPFTFRLTARLKSLDRLELLQSGYLRDASGELIGSLLNFENLKHLTNYMKTPNNKGISFYLENMITDPPKPENYDEFLNTYKSNWWHASRAHGRMIRRRQEKKQLAVLNKIERTVRAIAKITSFVTLHLVQRGLRRTCRFRASILDVKVIQRLLLCYNEEHDPALRYRVTYNTGDAELNAWMHRWLSAVLRDPRIVMKSNSDAKSAALALVQAFGAKYGLPRRCEIRNVISNGRIHTDDPRRDFPYRTRSRRRRYGVWTDRSRYRRNL